METELVYGDAWIRRLYGTPSGQTITEHFLSSHLVSRLYGAYQSSPMSRSKIWPFVEDFRIPMNEYEETQFKSFNDFFIRRFKPGARSFETTPSRMPAFAEARYFAFDHVTPDQKLPVKGRLLSPELLLKRPSLAKDFDQGPVLIARLCPVDYHRFHYPDDGTTLESYRIHGKLHSVNPLALKYKGEIFSTNERHVSILETRNFGKIAYIEVGALCVGKIVQTHTASTFARGDEKGYFLFGASTVIVLGQRGAWKPDADLLEKSNAGVETWVKLGEAIASVHP
jgi:phosphatidylserine decarboxylase